MKFENSKTVQLTVMAMGLFAAWILICVAISEYIIGPQGVLTTMYVDHLGLPRFWAIISSTITCYVLLVIGFKL